VISILNGILTHYFYRFLIFLAIIYSVIARGRVPTVKEFLPSFALLTFSKQLNEETSIHTSNDILHKRFQQAPRALRNLNSRLRVIRNFNPLMYLTTTPHSTALMSDSAPVPVAVTQPIYDSTTTISTPVTYADSAP